MQKYKKIMNAGEENHKYLIYKNKKPYISRAL